MILVSRLVGGGCSGVFLRSGVCPWLEIGSGDNGIVIRYYEFGMNPKYCKILTIENHNGFEFKI